MIVSYPILVVEDQDKFLSLPFWGQPTNVTLLYQQVVSKETLLQISSIRVLGRLHQNFL